MTKATVLKEGKPKLRQTKLCFASSKVYKKKDDLESTEKLEQSIKLLNIGKEQEQHVDPCEKCKKDVVRIHCTAIKDNNTMCPLSYCVQCVEKYTSETLDAIKQQDIIYVNKKGLELEHTDATPKWACLVCRGLCECKVCQPVKNNNSDKTKKNNSNNNNTNNTNNTNHESFFKNSIDNHKKESNITTTTIATTTTITTNNNINNKFTPKDLEPPTLTPITLLYSEKEIWVRLQIREWINRFGDIYDFDLRILPSLQNVQSDWRVKRLGAYVVWKFLTIIKASTTMLLDNNEKLSQMSKSIMQNWINEKKLTKLYTNEQAIQQALFDVMARDGISPKKWQLLAEVLAVAGYEDLPIPTMLGSKNLSHKNKRKDDDDDVEKDDDEDDDDQMDIDDEEEEDEDNNQQLLNKIKRYQTDTRSSHLISLSDELDMIYMLLELLLFESKARQSLVEIPKELREFETQIKKDRKQHAIEDLKKRSQKNALMNRISHLQLVKGGEEELSRLEIELDDLETAIRDEQLVMETHEFDFIKYNLKCQKRWTPMGMDHLGNQYWSFSDMVDHTNNVAYNRNNEPFWAFGIIVIGPGYDEKERKGGEKKEEEEIVDNKNQQDDNGWWCISGTKEMNKLEKWLIGHLSKDQTKGFLVHLKRHVQYLKSLEWVAYGEGFFS